jgi:hypothetical protein
MLENYTEVNFNTSEKGHIAQMLNSPEKSSTFWSSLANPLTISKQKLIDPQQFEFEV